MSHYYEVVIDHYSGPTRKTCRTIKEIRPLVNIMESKVWGGRGPTIVYKITTKDVTKEVLG